MKLERLGLQLLVGLLVRTVFGSSSLSSQRVEQQQPPAPQQEQPIASQSTSPHRILGQNRLPETYQDDIYHCENPNNDDDDSIPCDPQTWMWQVEFLQPEGPPLVCSRDSDHSGIEFRMDDVTVPEDLSPAEAQDAREPCILWIMKYGYLAPPTPLPTTSPTNSNTNNPTNKNPEMDDVPSSVETPSPTMVEADEDPSEEPPTQPKKDFDALELTFYFTPSSSPSERRLGQPQRRSLFSLDRSELHTLTALHLLEAIQAELGMDVVIGVNMLMQTVRIEDDEESSVVLTEAISGNLVFSSPATVIRSNALNRVVRQAFEGNAMDLYIFRLQIAEDETLQQTNLVLLADGNDGTMIGQDGDTTEGNSDDNNGSTAWTPTTITIAASVAAAILAMVGLAMILCWSTAKRRAVRRSHRRSDAPDKHQLRTLGTGPTYEDDDDGQDDRRRHQHHRHPSRQPPGPTNLEVDEDDGCSIGTSVYSYLQDDNSLSISVAPSVLYNIHESQSLSMIDDSRNQSVMGSSPGKAGTTSESFTMRSAIETISRHFHDDESLVDSSVIEGEGKYVEEQQNVNRSVNSSSSNMSAVLTSPPRILGPSFDSESRGSNSVVYDDESSLISDLGGGLAMLSKPAKQSFESLWRDDNDDGKSPSPPAKPLQEAKTVRKNNTRRSALAYHAVMTAPPSADSTPVKANAQKVGKAPPQASNTTGPRVRPVETGSKSSSKSRNKPVVSVSARLGEQIISPLAHDSPSIVSSVEAEPFEDASDTTARSSLRTTATSGVASMLEGVGKLDDSINTNNTNESSVQDKVSESGSPGAESNKSRKQFSPSSQDKDGPIVKSARTKRTSKTEWVPSPPDHPSNKNKNSNNDRAVSSTTGAEGMTGLRRLEKLLPANFNSNKANGELQEEDPVQLLSEKSPGGEDALDEVNDSRYISESDIDPASLKYLPQDASVIQGEDKFVATAADAHAPENASSPRASSPQDVTTPSVEKNDNIWRGGDSPNGNKRDGSQSSGIKAGTLIDSFDNVWIDEAKKSASPIPSESDKKTPDNQSGVLEDGNEGGEKKNPYLSNPKEIPEEGPANTSFASSAATERLNNLLADGGCTSEHASTTEDSRLISFCLRDNGRSFDIPVPFESLLDRTLEQDEDVPNDQQTPPILTGETEERVDEKKDDGDTICSELSANFNSNYKDVNDTMCSF